MRHFVFTALLATVIVGASLLAGPARRGAFLGAVSVSLTAFASLLLMKRSARAKRPVQAALAVVVFMFLARIIVVAAATAAVVRSGLNVVEFLVAFFVPYFIFAAIEFAYLNAIGRNTGTPA